MKRDVDDVESNDGSTGEQIVLISESGGRHQVDRNMLHRASGYFQGLVNSGMRDANYRELKLEYLTNESLIEVRDYLSKLSTNEIESLRSLNKVEAGLDGAFYLQLNDMIDCYTELLLKHLDKSTCIRILDIANKYVQINQVVNKVIKCMLKNFKEISESFKMSLLPDELFRLVASEEINANSEIDIFNLIIKWISEDQSRKCSAEKLLTEVRYGLMTTTEKQKCTAILHDLNLNINCNTDKDTNISRTVGMLLVVGSTESKNQDGNFFNIMPVYDFVEACNASSNGTEPSPIEFKQSSKKGLPRDLLRYNACVVDNCLYVVGGDPGFKNGTMFTHEVSVYNPVTAVWSKCCSMHLPRLNFYLGKLAGHLYAVCGFSTNFTGTPTVEKYIPSENRWHMVEPLPHALIRLAGCVRNGTIYISGGYDNRPEVRNNVYQYDPSCNKWFSRAPMLTARCYHVMTCTENKIFVIGGKTVPLVGFLIRNTIDGEMYDVESDQWSSVLKLKLPICESLFYNSSSITINNCLYIFQRDYSSDNQFRTFIQKINLTKYLKKKKTSNDSSLSSEQNRNANNKNLATNVAKKQNSLCVRAHADNDYQIVEYVAQKGKRLFDCQYIGVMIMSDV